MSDEKQLMYLYAEYNPSWIYYGWHLYLAPVENGIPNRHSSERVWVNRYDGILERVLGALGIECVDGQDNKIECIMRAYPAGVLLWSSRNNRVLELATDCGVEVWACLRAVRADREKDWYNDDESPARWRDWFHLANAEKRKLRAEQKRESGGDGA